VARQPEDLFDGKTVAVGVPLADTLDPRVFEARESGRWNGKGRGKFLGLVEVRCPELEVG